MFPVDIAKKFKNIFFYRKRPVDVSDGPTKVQLSQRGCVLFDFAPPCTFHVDQKLTQNATQVILYYYVTIFFLA